MLQVLGQSWVRTQAHTATLFLLPLLTYVITSVISGNIALSLGMVGALSIVRFRNPARSPLELSVYFGAITMGITASVSLIWLLFLIGSVTVVGIVLLSLSFGFKLFTKQELFVPSLPRGFNWVHCKLQAQRRSTSSMIMHCSLRRLVLAMSGATCFHLKISLSLKKSRLTSQMIRTFIQHP